MTRIDGASGMEALIRAQALEQARPRQTVQSQAGAGGARPTAKQVLGNSRLQANLLQRLGRIDVLDPDRRRKAFRMFMEDALLRAWGESIQSDPQFPGLVDQVLERMQADPELSVACLEAAEVLLAQAAEANALFGKTN